MDNRNAYKHGGPQEAHCHQCGKLFILRWEGMQWKNEKTAICQDCRRERARLRQKTREEQEWQRRQKERGLEKIVYERQLQGWHEVSVEEIQPGAEHVLYILGNGFDLMHNVPSSYYSFRDSLGKNNALRRALENYWTPEDLWADFEAALAQINVIAMSSSEMLNMWMEDFGAYDEDASVASFYLAAEAAADPMITVTEELQPHFRRWVESLKVGTADRPLRSLFRNGKVLCFNYTEFVETLYGVSEENVCYIHGCRRKMKNQPKDELILGHEPGASDAAFGYEEGKSAWRNLKQKCPLVSLAQEQVLYSIYEGDEQLTKHTAQIIQKHQVFFDSLGSIKQIIVIGHSLSDVDLPYFQKICENLPDQQDVHWYFGCHSLRDLQHIQQLIGKLDIPKSNAVVFRTDKISVLPLPVLTPPPKSPRCSLTQSQDEEWAAKITGKLLEVVRNREKAETYTIALPAAGGKAVFTPSGERLLVTLFGPEPIALLFGREGEHWHFVNELKGISNQGILNRRLRQVFLKEQEITFVYNNRIRVYDLRSGALLRNQQMKGARNRIFEGTEVTSWFRKN